VYTYIRSFCFCADSRNFQCYSHFRFPFSANVANLREKLVVKIFPSAKIKQERCGAADEDEDEAARSSENEEVAGWYGMGHGMGGR